MVEPVPWSGSRKDRRRFSRKERVRQTLGEARAALDGTMGLSLPTLPSPSERLQRWAFRWVGAWSAWGQNLQGKQRGRPFLYRHLASLAVLVLLGGTVLSQGLGLSAQEAKSIQGEGGRSFLVLEPSSRALTEAFDFAAAPMSVARRPAGEERITSPAEGGTAVAGRAELGRGEIVTYTVQPGDTLDSIAEHFKITAYTIFWVNGLHAPGTLQVGMVLVIPPLSGVPHTVREGETIESIADRYGVRPGNIVGYPPNGLKYPYDLQAGQEIFVPGGAIEIPRRWAGGERPAPTIHRMPGGEKLSWPTWGEISAPFGYSRSYGGYHHGLDIANVWGTPICAAAAGTVVEAGWDELGWHVMIDHGNGFRTVYGHLAERPWVAVGDAVEKGQRIGSMGRTYGRGGYATGVHLHFAVLHNGAYIDPLPLLEN